MDREWLIARLDRGDSIESIAREAEKNPSTVAYWVNKFGLASRHAAKHVAKGGVDRDTLARMVESGLTIEAMSASLGLGAASVKYWLRKYGLRTLRSRSRAFAGEMAGATDVIRRCQTHGLTLYVRSGASGRYRCRLCRAAHVSARRRRVKRILVTEAGGRCHLCGYDRYDGALQFHHVDRAAKAFSLSAEGIARSIDRAREEAEKCVLLCGNCHAEVEGGVATIGHSASEAQIQDV